MQQPTPHPVATGPAIPPASITTEQIQKYLEENNQLILALLENQSLGKLSECAQYQAQLQNNLLFLAAIADAQPQAPKAHPQQLMLPAAMQQGGHYMQWAPIFPSHPSFNPQQVQEQQQQKLNHHPQMMPFQGHIGMRPGIMNGMHAMRTEASHGAINALQTGPSMSEFRRGGTASNYVDGQGSKQDVGVAASEFAVADGHMNSASEHGNGDAESTQARRPEDSKTS